MTSTPEERLREATRLGYVRGTLDQREVPALVALTELRDVHPESLVEALQLVAAFVEGSRAGVRAIEGRPCPHSA